MVAQAPPRNYERIAWAVLLSSAATFTALVVTLVVGGRWWLLNATRDQGITNIPSGTVQITRPGRSAPEVNLQTIPPNSTVATEPDAQASLTFSSPGGSEVLATVQVFGNTQLHIERAASPRYSLSPQPHRIVLRLASGRVRVFVGVDVARQVQIEIVSEPGALTVLEQPGTNATVEGNFTETMVTVREGTAAITSGGSTISLNKDERAAVTAGQPPRGPLPAELNLIANSDFGTPLDGDWQVDKRDPVDANESPGDVEVVTLGGRRTLRLTRAGSNWGQVGVVQLLDRDVLGYASLRLHLELQLAFQDLWNCGLYGTECPMMVKITYVDVYGTSQEWLQGFYYNFDANPQHGLTYCVTCSVRFEHIAWPFAKWQIYDSDNLLQIFAANGAPAARIKSISLYASGHSFTSLTTDIQLLAAE